MPDSTRNAAKPPLRFRADRKVGRHDGFVAQFLPGLPADAGARSPAEPPPGSVGAGAPHLPSGAALVAADLRSARARQKPADAAPAPQAALHPAPDGAPAGHPSATGDAPPPAADLPPALPPADLERQLAAARDLGREEGRAEMSARLAAEREALAQAARALAAALAPLQRPPAEQVAALAQAVDAAVIRLASERAGYAIDRAPDGFALRVSRLAQRLACHQGGVTVRLHPKDLAAIAPLLADAAAHGLAPLAETRLVADPGLQRGDADLESSEIRIADLIGGHAEDDGA